MKKLKEFLDPFRLFNKEEHHDCGENLVFAREEQTLMPSISPVDRMYKCSVCGKKWFITPVPTHPWDDE